MATTTWSTESRITRSNSLYVYDDPWDASAYAAANGYRTSTRPVTWGGQSMPSPDTPTFDDQARALPLPQSYHKAWEKVCSSKVAEPYAAADGESDISLGQLHRLLSSAGGLGASASEKIVNLCCSGPRCSKYQFFQALALLKQSQDGQTFDIEQATTQLETGEAESPRIDLDSIPTTASTVHTFPPPPMSPGARSAAPNREMSDPWNSGSTAAVNHGAADRFSSNRDGLPSSGTSGFNSTFRGFASGSSDVGRSKKGSSSTNGDGPAPPPTAFRNALPEDQESQEGFGPMPSSRLFEGQSHLGASRFRSRNNPSAGGERPYSYASDLAEVNAMGGMDDPEAALPTDEVTVRLRSELAGFIIKHNVYVVTSRLRGSSVVRRYSDWVWLAECLVKRYPFRCLPVLPPKRITLPMPGKHLTAGDHFIEKRRRGLERYLSVLSSHPVLRQDKLVAVFFSETKPLAEWKQSAPPLYLDEEGMTKVLDEVEEMSIPQDLDTKLAQQRKAIPEMLERWTAIVNLFDRMVKRNDAAAADFSRFNFSLLSLVESSNKRWRPESDRPKATEDCIGRVAESTQDHADLASARATSASISTLEALKYQRDLVCSFRDLLIRLGRLLPDQVEGLKRRIDLSTKRAANIRREERPNWEVEYEKLISQVANDTAMVEKLMNRRVHTRKAMWEEMVWMHWRYRELEDAWKKFAQDEVVFSQAVLRNWEVLAMKLEM